MPGLLVRSIRTTYVIVLNLYTNLIWGDICVKAQWETQNLLVRSWSNSFLSGAVSDRMQFLLIWVDTRTSCVESSQRWNNNFLVNLSMPGFHEGSCTRSSMVRFENDPFYEMWHFPICHCTCLDRTSLIIINFLLAKCPLRKCLRRANQHRILDKISQPHWNFSLFLIPCRILQGIRILLSKKRIL